MSGPGGADRKFYIILFISFIFKSFFYGLGRLFHHTPQRINIAKLLVFIRCGEKSWNFRRFWLAVGSGKDFDWLWEPKKLEFPAFSKVLIGFGTIGTIGRPIKTYKKAGIFMHFDWLVLGKLFFNWLIQQKKLEFFVTDISWLTEF